MNGLPADALGLAALVFLLGLRHGLDPDHLVAIDGLTRASTREGARRWCTRSARNDACSSPGGIC